MRNLLVKQTVEESSKSVMKVKPSDDSLIGFIQNLGESGKSGCLNINDNDVEGKIYFRKGKIYFAKCNTRKKIGELLVEAGLVTGDQLQGAIEIQQNEANKKRRIGEIIAEIKTKENDPIDDDIDKFVREQIIDSLSCLIKLETATSEFVPSEIAFDEDVCIYFDPSQITHEMKEQLDELKEIRNLIPTPEMIIELNATPPTLSPPLCSVLIGLEQWSVIHELVKASTRISILDLKTKLNISTSECYKLIAGMLKSGIINLAESANID